MFTAGGNTSLPPAIFNYGLDRQLFCLDWPGVFQRIAGQLRALLASGGASGMAACSEPLPNQARY
jgi:hypothetical protein